MKKTGAMPPFEFVKDVIREDRIERHPLERGNERAVEELLQVSGSLGGVKVAMRMPIGSASSTGA